MNKLFVAAALAFAVGSSFADGAASPMDHGYAVYRQVVLGDTSVAPTRSPNGEGVADTRVLGPYAAYLVHLGMSKDDAIAQAERTGERSIQADRSVAIERPQLSSYELYQRSVLGHTESDILRGRQSSSQRLANVRVSAN